MENQYKKTFPNLMVGKKIIYVHGFMSAGSTHTAQILRDYMPQATVIAPDLPIHPEEAMELLRNLVKTENPDLIIGTSMGGMYTEMLYGVDRICVNPAFQMGSTITESNMMGKQVYQNERQDGEKEVIVTKALVKEYKEMTEQCFAQVTEEEQLKVFGLFGDEDPIVHTFDLFSEHYTQAIHFHGEHRLIEKAIFHYLMPVIRWIDDRQEGREQRTVLISQDTLADGYGKPKSSLHKAYELLLDNYNVYFVSPAPTNNPSVITEQQAWIEETFSAPAWNHAIFTNQPQLLYGDYFISSTEQPDFLGTVLRFGSDEFKTWEEIITYFERLGGQ
ncbi:esterase [Prevotella histicola]|uniref:YqiA/YcfP family alpha/beta fold hydrolase n=1 Tax=Prevotella histicola TaxID=470565 RepID=UPI001C5E7E44|nr:YqiA/YcfP family alpha/beta fold hydrolase [Prevotella histicola]MBW4712230.1 esterase [Prevotella histicola]MBW4877169.1 esterase [Prevotella histicola]MBW4921245.1 esterase [Prevotella histicola]